MRIMTKRTILPLLVALAVLALAAASAYQPTPVGAQSDGALAPPTVNLTAAASCSPDNPKTYLVVTYGSVADAASYQYQVKWGRAGNFGDWRAVPDGIKPGKAWSPNIGRYLSPGEVYAVRVRALNADGGEGDVGADRFSYELGDASAPDNVRVAYTPNGDSIDYTRAQLTWQGNEGSGGWFSVQQRAMDGKWKSSGWQQFSQLDGDASPYFHDVSDLDAEKGHLFRVTGHTPSCQPSAWSDAVSLWPTLLSTAAVAVHEADGFWHRQADDGPVWFKVSQKGDVRVRWSDWVGVVEHQLGGGETEEVQVASWTITAVGSDGKVRTKNTETASPREVTFKNFAMGESYDVVVKGLDPDGDQLGVAQMVTIRPVHTEAPSSISGLVLTPDNDNLSLTVNWTAPDVVPGIKGKPKRYALWLTNTDTGRARGKWINITTRGKEHALKTETEFDGLWPGDTYRVSVSARNISSRVSGGRSWQSSDWVSDTVTMPAGDDPSYAKVVPTLIWEPVLAGEKAPPYVVGDPTAYIVSDASVAGGYVRFDAPNQCREYRDPHRFFLHEESDAGAKAAILKAERQERLYVKPARAGLAAAEAAKQKYLDDTPEAERSAAKIAELDADIARKQGEVDAAEKILADLVTKVETECARAYPAVENLTQDDDRWYQVAQTKETEPTER